MIASENIFKYLNTAAIYVFIGVFCFWMFFKQSPGIDKETINKLSIAVTNLGKAADTINQASIAQKAWAEELEKTLKNRQDERQLNYDDLFNKYGYNKEDHINLNDLYNFGLRNQTNSLGGEQLLNNPNPVKKSRVVQDTITESKVGSSDNT
jgi:hypothetical protein